MVAVGARPSLPRLPGLDLAITSDDALEHMEDKPDHLVVVGGGYIGVELATIFHALGIETTLVIRRTEPLRGFDSDARAAATEEMRRRGLDIRSSATVNQLERTGGRLVLHTTAGPIPADTVLYATGREAIPNTEQSRIEQLGVRTDAIRAPSASIQPTRAACPASTRSATAATTPRRGWTSACSTSRRSRSPRAG